MTREQVLEHMAAMRERKAQLQESTNRKLGIGKPHCLKRVGRVAPVRYCRCERCIIARERKRDRKMSFSKRGRAGGLARWAYEKRKPVETKAGAKQVKRDRGVLVSPMGLEMKNMLEQWVERVKEMGLTSARARISCGKFGHAGVVIDLE